VKSSVAPEGNNFIILGCMAKYERFEDLPVWQDAARLYNAVLDLLEEEHCPLTLGFRSQLDRAALSPSNNIAEGFERASTKELVGYLVIARDSAGEVRSMIATVKNRQRLIELKEHFAVIVRLAESCTRQITAWITSIENSPIKGKRYRAQAGMKDPPGGPRGARCPE
jgi:four helix bundle protein